MVSSSWSRWVKSPVNGVFITFLATRNKRSSYCGRRGEARSLSTGPALNPREKKSSFFPLASTDKFLAVRYFPLWQVHPVCLLLAKLAMSVVYMNQGLLKAPAWIVKSGNDSNLKRRFWFFRIQAHHNSLEPWQVLPQTHHFLSEHQASLSFHSSVWADFGVSKRDAKSTTWLNK